MGLYQRYWYKMCFDPELKIFRIRQDPLDQNHKIDEFTGKGRGL
jgi:hypothetical protein